MNGSVGRSRVVEAGRHLAVFGGALALLLALPGHQAAAVNEPCRVRNAQTGEVRSRLQSAVNHASPGDRLVVEGTCRGVTVIDRNLVIQGHRTNAWGVAVLDGEREGDVVTVPEGVTVTMRALNVRGGFASVDPFGGGIVNHGSLLLRYVKVRHNRGFGVYNDGSLSLIGGTRVSHNPGDAGYAVFNEGTLAMNDASSIGRNGNLGVFNEGTLTLNDASSIHDNEYHGVSNDGDLTLNDASQISANRWHGVSNRGTLTLNGTSRIVLNHRAAVHNRGIVLLNDSSRISWNKGSGVYLQYSGSLTLDDGSRISRNVAPRGGGVFIRRGTLTLEGESRIARNTARRTGGGLYVDPGATLVGVTCGPAAGANVRDNAPDDCYFE